NKLGDFDIVALLLFVTHCKHFEAYGLKPFCEKVVNVRNKVMHSPNYELEQEELHEYLDRIKALGKKLEEKVPEFAKLSKDIQGIQNMDFTLVFPQPYQAAMGNRQHHNTPHLLNTLRQNKSAEETETLLFAAVQKARVRRGVYIAEQLSPSEVDKLYILCHDVLGRKALKNVKDGTELFQRLEEKGLLENNSFLSHLLHSIHRADLLNLLETDSRRLEENFDPQADAAPVLSDYGVMLHQIHKNLTHVNLKMKCCLTSKLGKGQMETCKVRISPHTQIYPYTHSGQ
ncbi:hypothetical protein LDENG_00257220, partial [Lucifuga dentata]